jgi:hypothetical protein
VKRLPNSGLHVKGSLSHPILRAFARANSRASVADHSGLSRSHHKPGPSNRTPHCPWNIRRAYPRRVPRNFRTGSCKSSRACRRDRSSFHAIIFACGRQIYSLSRAGYSPHFLSLTHGQHKTSNIAIVTEALIGLGVMLVVWFSMEGQVAGAFIGGVLVNMAVFGAMFSYLLQGLLYPTTSAV